MNSRPEPSHEQKQAAYVAHRAIVRAQSMQAETARKARQEAMENAKAVAQVPDAE